MRLIRTISTLAPLALATVASAQAEKPPEPSFTPQTNPVVGYLIMAVLFGIRPDLDPRALLILEGYALDLAGVGRARDAEDLVVVLGLALL
jgi:hypothetical protein